MNSDRAFMGTPPECPDLFPSINVPMGKWLVFFTASIDFYAQL